VKPEPWIRPYRGTELLLEDPWRSPAADAEPLFKTAPHRNQGPFSHSTRFVTSSVRLPDDDLPRPAAMRAGSSQGRSPNLPRIASITRF
jgi:hypothetical protein